MPERSAGATFEKARENRTSSIELGSGETIEYSVAHGMREMSHDHPVAETMGSWEEYSSADQGLSLSSAITKNREADIMIGVMSEESVRFGEWVEVSFKVDAGIDNLDLLEKRTQFGGGLRRAVDAGYIDVRFGSGEIIISPTELFIQNIARNKEGGGIVESDADTDSPDETET